MICDEEKAVGIAGIMGGENSKITDDVKTMLFEAACFDGTNIRLSSKKVGLRTDASGKFEKGLDPNNAEAAINRACQLIEELGAGEVVGGIVDFYPEKRQPSRVKFDAARINKLLGTDISTDEMLGYLKMVELEYDEVKKFFLEFKHTLPKLLHKMEDALERSDFKEVSGVAHQLKGSSGSLKIDKIYRLAYELESAANQETITQCRVVLKQIKDAL